MKRLILGLLTIFVLTACDGGLSTSIQGEWTLVSYGTPSDQTPAMPDVETSIVFDSEGRMSGNVGCNGFGGNYTIKDEQIEFGPVMSTMMFCETIAEQESTTLAVFQETATYIFDGNTLTITSTDGSSAIVLEPK